MSADDHGFHYLFENTVRFEETDAQGVVFFGNYLTYLDEAIMAYWREVGYPYEDIVEADWEVFVVHSDLDYHASAGFADTLRNGVRVSEIGTSSLTFEYRCERAEDDVLIASGSLVQVAADDDGQPRPIPNGLREAIVAFEDGASDTR